jgi:hypothetical protein
MGVAEAHRDGVQAGWLQRVESAEREVRHIGDAVAGKVIDQGVVVAMRQIVEVLHARDLADPAPLGDLGGSDVA